MATVDKLIVRIEADMRDLKNKLKSAERSTQQSTTKMRQSFTRLKTAIGGVTSTIFSLKGALIGLGVGAGIRSIVKTGMEIESLKIRLELLFGSVEEGSKAFEVMADFASKVPFSLGQIQQGAGALAVVTKNAKELGEMLEITGNVAAATNIDFATSSLQIQRAFSSGLASAEIFNERGVREMLGFQAGATVSIEETSEAFKRVFAGDGEFAKAANRLATTLGGTLSMLGDKVFNFQRAINDEGFFEELKTQFSDLDKSLTVNADAVDELARKIAQGLVVATKSLSDALVFVNDNFKAVVTIIGAFIAMKLTLIVTNIAVSFALLAKNILLTNTAMRILNFLMIKNPILGGATILIGVLAKVTGMLDGIIARIQEAAEGLAKFFGLGGGGGLAPPPKENEKDNRKIDDIAVVPSVRDLMLRGTFTRPDITGTESRDIDRFTREIGNREIGVNPEILERRANAMKRANAEIQKAINLEEKHNQLLKALGINTEGYSDKVDNLKSLLDANEITLKQYHERLGELRIELAKTSPKLEIFIEGLERTMDSLAQTMADSLLQMGDGWKGFRDSLKNIVRDIIAQLLRLQAQQAITRTLGSIGGSGGGGFDFGKILSIGSSIFGFGGGGAPDVAGFANGGSLSPRQPAIVGEKGPELFVPHTSGGIFTNRSLNNMGGGGVSVNQTINIETGVSQTVRAEMLSLLPQIKSETIGAVIDSKKRGGQMAETFS